MTAIVTANVGGVSCTLNNAVIVNVQHSAVQVGKVLRVEKPSIVHLPQQPTAAASLFLHDTVWRNTGTDEQQPVHSTTSSSPESYAGDICHYSAPSPTEIQSTAIGVSVCLSTSMSHVSKTRCLLLYRIFCTCYLWQWLGPPLAALWYIMYFCFHGWCHVCT